MLTCKDVAEFLMDYLDCGLPAGQRTEFERHLAICPTCVDYMQTYEMTVKAGKAAFAESDAQPEMPEELVRAILAARKSG